MNWAYLFTLIPFAPKAIAYALLIMSAPFGSDFGNVLSARSEFLDPSYLASTQAGTPDLYHGCFKGQQVVITWNLPARTPYREIQMELNIVYGNGTMDSFCAPIGALRGNKSFRLINKKYKEKEGILTYQVKLNKGEKTVASCEHQLWQELVCFDQETNYSQSS